MKIAFRKHAELDLRQIRDHIAKDSPQNASTVIARILSAVENNLAQYPYMGRSGLVENTREWAVLGPPYVVVYQVDESREILNVINVLHAARNR